MISLRELPPGEPNIQHKAPLPNVPFDDNGEPCGKVEFAFPKDEPEDDARADAREVILEFLRLLCTDSTALLTGQRMHLLAYLAGVTEHQTHRELADALNVSPGRVSQILQALPSELQSIARLKGRTAKAQGQ